MWHSPRESRLHYTPKNIGLTNAQCNGWNHKSELLSSTSVKNSISWRHERVYGTAAINGNLLLIKQRDDENNIRHFTAFVIHLRGGGGVVMGNNGIF